MPSAADRHGSTQRAARMAKSAAELSHWPEYDYVIVNRDIEASVARVEAIVTAARRAAPARSASPIASNRLLRFCSQRNDALTEAVPV